MVAENGTVELLHEWIEPPKVETEVLQWNLYDKITYLPTPEGLTWRA